MYVIQKSEVWLITQRGSLVSGYGISHIVWADNSETSSTLSQLVTVTKQVRII